MITVLQWYSAMCSMLDCKGQVDKGHPAFGVVQHTGISDIPKPVNLERDLLASLQQGKHMQLRVLHNKHHDSTVVLK